MYFVRFSEFDKKNFIFLLTSMNSTKKNYFFARFSEFDKKNFIFSPALVNSTKKIYFFAHFSEFEQKDFILKQYCAFVRNFCSVLYCSRL